MWMRRSCELWVHMLTKIWMCKQNKQVFGVKSKRFDVKQDLLGRRLITSVTSSQPGFWFLMNMWSFANSCRASSVAQQKPAVFGSDIARGCSTGDSRLFTSDRPPPPCQPVSWTQPHPSEGHQSGFPSEPVWGLRLRLRGTSRSQTANTVKHNIINI